MTFPTSPTRTSVPHCRLPTRSSTCTGFAHPALGTLAGIVRAANADTATLAARAAQAPGLLAASLGLSAMFADDHAMLKWGMLVYDSLYAWCRGAQTETPRLVSEKFQASHGTRRVKPFEGT